MKISCLQENLNKGLITVSRLISSKTQLPILGNILLTAEKGQLKLSVTNLETGINFQIGAKVEKEGSLAISARPLGEMVASLPAEKIELQAEGDILKVSCGKYQASFNGLSAKEFPTLPAFPQKEKVSFPADIFSQAIGEVAFAAAQDEGRPVLTGIKWAKEEGDLLLTATDGYRLSLKKVPFKVDFLEKELIVSARTLLEVAHILGEKGKEEKEVAATLLPEENQIGFFLESVEITTRLIEGEFPNVTQIIPQGFTTKVTLEKETLLKAVKIASIFARDSANIVKWKIDPSADGGKVTLSANSPQVGENSSEIEAKVEGEGGEIAFNFRYLLDFLQAVKSEEIVLEMSGPLNPGVFKPLGDDSFLHIIMPVRVQG